MGNVLIVYSNVLFVLIAVLLPFTFIGCHWSSVCEYESVSKLCLKIGVILSSPVFRLLIFEPLPLPRLFIMCQVFNYFL